MFSWNIIVLYIVMSVCMSIVCCSEGVGFDEYGVCGIIREKLIRFEVLIICFVILIFFLVSGVVIW